MGVRSEVLCHLAVSDREKAVKFAKTILTDSFDESKHRRDQNGRFASMGGGGSRENARKIYDKLSGGSYKVTDGDLVPLSRKKSYNAPPEQTGSVTVPKNPNKSKVMVCKLPSGGKALNDFDETQNTILPGGRVALTQSASREGIRHRVGEMLENEISILGGIRQDGIFWRVSSDDKEKEYIRKGTIRPSVNHATGQKEDGLSVWEIPKYARKNMVRVSGEVIGIGTDGEPLLDVKTVKLEPDLKVSVPEARKAGIKKFCEKYDWTLDQVESALRGGFDLPMEALKPD